MATAFHETRFPVDVAFGSVGGPERRTEIVALGSGHERRNARWSLSRRRFDAGYGLRSLDDLAAVIAFFEERRGRLYGFRFRDPLDFRSGLPSAAPAPADQVLGTGDGTTASFALRKRYGGSDAPFYRPIEKPVAGTVRVAVGGVERTSPAGFSVDVTTGTVSFPAGQIPAAGLLVTAGFEFDVPARFDTDRLEINLQAFAAGALPAIPIVEIRP